MTNKITINSNVTPIKSVSETAGGNTYSLNTIDENIKRPFGGIYNLPAYADGAIARWSGVVIDVTTAQALSDGTAFETNPAVTDGTLPTSVLAYAVEYVSELGTVGQVVLTIGTQVFAELSVREGIIIPISGASGIGLAIANIKIHADVYSDGVNEATVNVMLAGV